VYHVLPLYQFVPEEGNYLARKAGDRAMPLRKV